MEQDRIGAEAPGAYGVRELLRAFEYAMAFECVPLATQRRILNRLIYGEAEGPRVVYEASDLPAMPDAVAELLLRTARAEIAAAGSLPRPPWAARPDISGFAGPRHCHTTPAGIRVHVRPGCRCPKGRR